MTSPIRVFIADDHPDLRTSLRSAIEAQPDMQVTGEATSCEGTIARVKETPPDVLVLDLHLTDGNGWVVLERLATTGQLPPTLVLSACEESVFARRLLAAGARGYLMKEAPLARIVAAIREIHGGLLVASQPVTSQLMAEAVGHRDLAPEDQDGVQCFGPLSARELQICAMLGAGLRSKEIANTLGVSAKTVATYKLRIMQKFGVASTPELIERYRTFGVSATTALS